MSARRLVACAVLATSLLVLCPVASRAQQEVPGAPLDTNTLLADTLQALPIRIDFGPGLGSTLAVSLDAATAGADAKRRGARTKLRLTRAPDSLSAGLARRVASGARISRIDAVLPVQDGGQLLLHLGDVVVVSSHLTAMPGDLVLAQEQLGIQETLAQLTTESGEAERQLAALGTLEQRNLSAPLDVARARAHSELLASRIESQRRRLAIVQWRRTHRMPVVEEIVLDAGRIDSELR
jgi:hypothetical protein